MQPPEPLATFLDLNGYLPIGVPMLEARARPSGADVFAEPASRFRSTTSQWARRRITTDEARPLPKWQGCRVVGDGELFLMNWQSDDSLDGRYFGFFRHRP